MAQTLAPFAKPLYVMTKPVGAVCNLACKYCYYLEKSNLYKDNSKHVMSDELLEKFIKEYKARKYALWGYRKKLLFKINQDGLNHPEDILNK